jgi:hypothetical protein
MQKSPRVGEMNLTPFHKQSTSSVPTLILHAVGLYWVPGHAGVRGNENHRWDYKERLCFKGCMTGAGLWSL